MNTVVIDDSGSPGSQIESRFLTNRRKTWVAAFIEDSCVTKITSELKELNLLLKKYLNVSELHFADLVNGNREFKHLSQDRRYELFAKFCRYYKDYQFPFCVQTTNPETLAENGIVIRVKSMPYGGLDLVKHEHQGLLLLLIKIKGYLQMKGILDRPVDFVIDEGIRKPGVCLKPPILRHIGNDSALRFASSKTESIIQIGDFLAFSVNRTQSTIVKPPKDRTDYDKFILAAISSAIGKSAFSGISYSIVDPNTVTNDDYDYEQIVKRQEDGTLNKYKFYRRNKEDL